MEITFYAKPKKIGNSYYALIPMDYITNNLVDVTKETKLIIGSEKK